jgi:hypothetical protein
MFFRILLSVTFAVEAMKLVTAFASPRKKVLPFSPTTTRSLIRGDCIYNINGDNFLTALYAEKKYPMIVIGNGSAALGASFALCAREVVLERQRGVAESESLVKSAPTPPAQLIALFQQHQQETQISETESMLQNTLLFGQYHGDTRSSGETVYPTINNYQQMFTDIDNFLSCIYADESQYGKPIVHVSIAKEALLSRDELQPVLEPAVRSNVSFLGFNLDTFSCQDFSTDLQQPILPKDDAMQWGNMMQIVLDGLESANIPAAVTMDLATHLAMLQANRLPRTRGVLGNHVDNWAIRENLIDGSRIDNGESILFEYKYDFDNSMGGTDPLLCPSKGTLIPSPIDTFNCSQQQHESADDAHAAAYSAMRGSGMDHISAICVATGVKAVFLDMDNGDESMSDECCFPPYTWDVVEQIVKHCSKARLGADEEEGMSRKKYREFGYK